MDFLKIIAIVLVLFNHTKKSGYIYFFHARGSAFYPVYLAVSFLDRIAVPLFFMISGALLIPREESYRNVLKRFFRFFFVLIAASLISYGYIILFREPRGFSIMEFIRILYSKGVIVPYWYLYAYLAYILMLPLIRKMAHHMDSKDFQWLILLYILLAAVSVIDHAVYKGKYLHNSNFSLFIKSSYVFYPMLGYYLEHKTRDIFYTKKHLVFILSAAFITVILCSFLTHFRCTSLNVWKENDLPFFSHLFMVVPVSAIFIAVKMLFDRFPPKLSVSGAIRQIAGTTFGIYLIEQILRTEFEFILDWMKSFIHPYIACWIWVLLLCMIGGIIIYLIRLIPGVKKFI